MIEVRPGGRRRIDRVLEPDYMQGVQTGTLDEVRALRDEAAQEETDLSYLRRLLHGRIDIVHAEQQQAASRAAGPPWWIAGLDPVRERRRAGHRLGRHRPWSPRAPRRTAGTSRRWCPTWTCPTSRRCPTRS